MPFVLSRFATQNFQRQYSSAVMLAFSPLQCEQATVKFAMPLSPPRLSGIL
jgi:hypothetical protein